MHPVFVGIKGIGRTFLVTTSDNEVYHIGENMPKLYMFTRSKAPGMQRVLNPNQQITDLCLDFKKCFYTGADGSLYGWGDNTWFEINHSGNETKNKVSKLNYKIEQLNPSQDLDKENFSSGAEFIMARTCNDCSFFVTQKGVYSIGNKTVGILGYHPPSEVMIHPKKIEFNNLSVGFKVVGVSASNFHVVAWTSSGEAYSWGHNYNGVLGIENNRRWQDKLFATPQRVKVLENSFVTSMEACDSCSFAVNHRGKLFYWGRYKTIIRGFCFLPRSWSSFQRWSSWSLLIQTKVVIMDFF